jgi:hypothetical protein
MARRAAGRADEISAGSSLQPDQGTAPGHCGRKRHRVGAIDDAVGWSDLCQRIGIVDPGTKIIEPKVKDELKRNGERAVAAGVFGVPSFIIGGELFWGVDATEMMLDYLRNPQRFASGELGRVATLPVGVERPQT